MAFKVGERIREQAAAGGTGNFTLAPVTDWRAYSTELTSNGDTSWYMAVNGSEWEQGILTRVSSTVYSRAVARSSNADALVNFTVAPEVFCMAPASVFPPAGFGAVNAVSAGAQGPFSSGVATKIALLGAKEYDPENVFDNVTNSRYNCLLTGVYEFTLKLSRGNGTTSIQSSMMIYKNGASYSNVYEDTATWSSRTVTHAGKFAAGDYAEFFFLTADAATSTTGCRLQVKLLRALP